ncbi:radical SAM family heme chaperone HemW [Labilibacter sediminis]|nr:radical SAM family heme chaperone HemW [Labilibacter sediminis]
MAGIYIHVPYCIQKCGYCDFYSIIRLTSKEDFVATLIKEIEIRKSALVKEGIQTIYFGGGTPSLLSIDELGRIYKALKEHFDISNVQEVTIEVNPDDVTHDFLKSLKNIGFNRLSMGVQSFNNKILAFMNRRHSADQAKNAVQIAKQAGFNNISIDLIYGIPNMSMECWRDSIDQTIDMDVQHISAYHLTFEPDTPFFTKLKRNEIQEIKDDDSLQQYNLLVKRLTEAGFIDYEISNFSKPSLESQHNSNYWKGNNYLGLGPSAHSFINQVRSWNVSDLNEYISLVNNAKNFSEQEELSFKDIYNETIMLGLRTRKGVDLKQLKHDGNPEILSHFSKELKINMAAGNVYEQEGFIRISDDKKFLTDKIISNFFIV